MKKNKAIDARAYSFTASDAIMPDANIWLYLNGPVTNPGSWPVRTYSAVLANLLTAGSPLFLDVLVIGEFINRFARLEMKRLQPGQNDFKAFRRSTHFPSVAGAIQHQAKQILAICRPLHHPFADWNLPQLLTEFATGGTDWNDQLLIENCVKQGVELLTNDGDFTEGGIRVFTANGKLLAACP